jgi:hypothetical protein
VNSKEDTRHDNQQPIAPRNTLDVMPMSCERQRHQQQRSDDQASSSNRQRRDTLRLRVADEDSSAGCSHDPRQEHQPDLQRRAGGFGCGGGSRHFFVLVLEVPLRLRVRAGHRVEKLLVAIRLAQALQQLLRRTHLPNIFVLRQMRPHAAQREHARQDVGTQ